MTAAIEALHGSLTALATPFCHGRIDEAALVRLTERQIDHGTAALVVCGSTGEASALSSDETERAVACVVRAARRRVPVIAGCTAAATATSVALAVAAARAGADALLLAAPPYVKATQEGIFAHVRAVAHAADRPVMLYDVPGRSGVAIADATVGRLVAAELIFAIKDATADLSRPPRLAALCGGATLRQFSGDDATAAAHRAMGGVGCVSVSANLTPALCMQLHQSWEAGNAAAFARCRDLLDPLHRALFVESNPIALKAALARLGLCRDELRLPLTGASDATRQAIDVVLARLMPLEQLAAAPAWLALAG
jgi:4-hydroxy-tetrahydrodipicolinate synthase